MARSRADGIAARRRDVLAGLEDIDRQLAELRALRETVSDDDEHDPDGVSLSSEWSRLEGLKQTQLQALAATDAAAARVESGDDGTCVVCGDPLAPERLEARPDATTCIRCAR